MEVKDVIDALDPKLKAYKDEMADNVKNVKDAYDAQLQEFKEWRVKKDETEKKNQEALDALVAQGSVLKTQTGVKDFGSVFADSIKDNLGSIQRVSKGKGFEMELKDVGNMTAAANLTGEAVATYQPGAVIKPSNKVNFRDIVGTFPSGTGIYVNYRETTSEGSIGLTSAGGSKSQIDYDFARVVYTGVYIAGYARIAKEMLQDLPFMQTVLPRLLLRDFYKKENTQMYADWKAAASGGAAVSGTNNIEKIINQIGSMEDADYDVNGIVLKPSVVTGIQNTKPSDYGLPGAVFMSNGGELSINGVAVRKASWADATHINLGDWSNARIGVVDGLKIEFFEQDGDNVTKNLVTVRVEAREFLAIDDPAAFAYRAFG